MATLATFRSRIVAKVGLWDSGSGDQTLINDWINEGYKDVVRRARFNVSSGSYALTSGSANYEMTTVSVSAMAVIEMALETSSQTYPMERVPIEEMIRLRRASGSPPARYYTMMGQNLLLLYPTPGTGETLRLYVVNRPPTISGSESTSIVPDEWDKAIELYALWQAAEYDQQPSSRLGEIYYRRYLEYMADMKKQARWLGGKRLAPGIPARRGRPLPAVARDVDTGR